MTQKFTGTITTSFNVELIEPTQKMVPFTAIFESISSIFMSFDHKEFVIYSISENSFYFIDENNAINPVIIENKELAKEIIISRIIDLGNAENLEVIKNSAPEYIFNNIYGMHVGNRF